MRRGGLLGKLTSGSSFKSPANAKLLQTLEDPSKKASSDSDDRLPSAILERAGVDAEEDELYKTRAALKLRVSGRGEHRFPPMLEYSLETLDHQSQLLQNIEDSDYKEPTPIQMQAIPALAARRDLLAVAPTGSGKTASFLLPIFLSARRVVREEGKKRDGLFSLILVPTHELAEQTLRNVRALGAGLGLRASVLKDGTKAVVREALSMKPGSGLDVLIATPQSMVDLIHESDPPPPALGRLAYLVLDEADRLLDEGFRAQLDEIFSACQEESGHHRVNGLFSATMPDSILAYAEAVLVDPLRVVLGSKDASAAETVAQELLYVGEEEGKLLGVKSLVSEGRLPPPCLVFAQTKHRANDVAKELSLLGLRADALHGDRTPAQRDAVIARFRRGEIWYLVATDLASRGLDFKSVKSVLNYDFPSSAVSYVHRVGRCGRAGRAGVAVTFVTDDDKPRLRAIANIASLTSQSSSGSNRVPEWMIGLKRPGKTQRKAFMPKITSRVGQTGMSARAPDAKRRKKRKLERGEQEEQEEQEEEDEEVEEDE